MDFSGAGMQILGTVMEMLVIILASLATWAVSLIGRKMGIELNLSKDALIRRGIRNAIAGAEEWAEERIKYEDVSKVSAAEKLKFVRGIIKSQFPKLVPDDLDRMLKEELAQMEGVGATGDRVVK